jgi:hypothetical protein
MCCCGKPVINGQPGYKWQPNDKPGVYPAMPPALGEHDTLLFDEPGRCGGLDAHCHHYRVVKRRGVLYLLVKHGGGEEAFRLSSTDSLTETLSALDTNARYWLLHTIYYAHHDGISDGYKEATDKWYKAAAEKRIKTRKQRNSDRVKVWIEQCSRMK